MEGERETGVVLKVFRSYECPQGKIKLRGGLSHTERCRGREREIGGNEIFAKVGVLEIN